MAALVQRQCCPVRTAVAFAASGDQNADAVETDPSQRYLRVRFTAAADSVTALLRHCNQHRQSTLSTFLCLQYPVLLGRGACKRVYKGVVHNLQRVACNSPAAILSHLDVCTARRCCCCSTAVILSSAQPNTTLKVDKH
jgi:hypothetical protein